MTKNRRKIAVILSGCGNKDGAEITEAVSLIVALSEGNALVDFYAPNLFVPAKNFLTDQALPEKRNVMLESARITRSKISDLNLLDANKYDGLALPGGYGAALHLSNWAEKGSHGQVLPELAKQLSVFHEQSKPIAAICIAPAVVALVLGKHKITLTLGNSPEAIHEVEKTGAIHEICPVTDYITDREHKIITTPAYMYDAKPHELFKGISGLAKELIEMS